MLPFKTNPNLTYAIGQIETIQDGLGNSLDIPKYGCLTWEEYEQYSQYTLAASKSDDLSLDTYRANVVVDFLRSRFKIDSTISKSELLKLADGTPIPYPMLQALWSFFEGEMNRWQIEEKAPERKTTKK